MIVVEADHEVFHGQCPIVRNRHDDGFGHQMRPTGTQRHDVAEGRELGHNLRPKREYVLRIRRGPKQPVHIGINQRRDQHGLAGREWRGL